MHPSFHIGMMYLLALARTGNLQYPVHHSQRTAISSGKTLETGSQIRNAMRTQKQIPTHASRHKRRQVRTHARANAGTQARRHASMQARRQASMQARRRQAGKQAGTQAGRQAGKQASTHALRKNSKTRTRALACSTHRCYTEYGKHVSARHLLSFVCSSCFVFLYLPFSDDAINCDLGMSGIETIRS